jgi:hypothetical protein
MQFTVNTKEKTITWEFQDDEEHQQLLAAVAKLMATTGQFIPKDPTSELILPDSSPPEIIVFVPNVLQSINKEEMFNA